MKLSRRAASILVLGSISALPLSAVAEVKSLSSSELTETYIKDSTIIVMPKKQQQASRQQTITSLSISPTDMSQSEIEEISHSQNHLKDTKTAFVLSDELMRNSSVDDAVALTTNPQPNILSFDEINAPPPISEILNDDRYAVPEGTQWARNYAGDQLGISMNGGANGDRYYTISIGNPVGINPIHIPEAIHEGPVDLVPREGGGFDLTIKLPDRN